MSTDMNDAAIELAREITDAGDKLTSSEFVDWLSNQKILMTRGIILLSQALLDCKEERDALVARLRDAERQLGDIEDLHS